MSETAALPCQLALQCKLRLQSREAARAGRSLQSQRSGRGASLATATDMANLLWLQGGACSGNTMSFLNAEQPSVCDLVTDFGIHVLWHPSLGMELGDNVRELLRSLTSGQLALDIFVFEGTVVQAPNGTGEWNR